MISFLDDPSNGSNTTFAASPGPILINLDGDAVFKVGSGLTVDFQQALFIGSGGLVKKGLGNTADQWEQRLRRSNCCQSRQPECDAWIGTPHRCFV